MAVKAKRITCARCGERESIMRGERGPASIYCDLCRDEVKREQAALRAQAYRQRRRFPRSAAPACGCRANGTHYRFTLASARLNRELGTGNEAF
jgi:hypothetical protein